MLVAVRSPGSKDATASNRVAPHGSSFFSAESERPNRVVLLPFVELLEDRGVEEVEHLEGVGDEFAPWDLAVESFGLGAGHVLAGAGIVEKARFRVAVRVGDGRLDGEDVKRGVVGRVDDFVEVLPARHLVVKAQEERDCRRSRSSLQGGSCP